MCRDREIRLYYGASNGTHNGWRDGFLALATLRPDKTGRGTRLADLGAARRLLRLVRPGVTLDEEKSAPYSVWVE